MSRAEDRHSTPVGMWLLPRNQGTDLRHRAGIDDQSLTSPVVKLLDTGVFSSAGSPNNLDEGAVARLLAGWSLFGGDEDASQDA